MKVIQGRKDCYHNYINYDLSAVDIANRLFNEQEDTSNESITKFGFGYPSVTNINIAKFKTNLKVIIPKQNNMISILDAAQVSDFVLLGISATEEMEKTHLVKPSYVH